MKYKNIYKEENIDIATGTSIYGSFIIAENYSFDMLFDIPCLVASNVQLDNNHRPIKYYGLVNENDFCKDINRYGKKLYSIFKNDFNQLYKYKSMLNIKHKSLLNRDVIMNNVDAVLPICLSFVNDYGLPINMREMLDFTNCKEYKLLARKYALTCIPIELIINQILVYYILNLVFKNLASGYKNNIQAYNVLSIDKSITSLNIFEANLMILDILASFISSRFFPLNESRNYMLKLVRANDNTIIPIRYTFNIFTFALERFVNDLSTLSFKEDDEVFDETTYYIIRKCRKCLSNTVDIKTIKNNIKVPTTKRIYCEDCEHKERIERNKRYEHSLRALYDELKANIDKCNPKLANEIRNLKPKDKETKSHLIELYDQYKNDSK